MHRECQESFPRHRLQRKPLVSDPGMQKHVVASILSTLMSTCKPCPCSVRDALWKVQVQSNLSWHYYGWIIFPAIWRFIVSHFRRRQQTSSKDKIQLWMHTQTLIKIQVCNQMPLYHGPISHDITYGTTITVAEWKSDFRITADITYLAITGEI